MAEGVSHGQYCLANRHACIGHGCRSRRLEDEDAKGFCLTHFQEDAAESAASEAQSGFEERLRREAAENERLRRHAAQVLQREREREEAATRRRARDQGIRDRGRRAEEEQARAAPARLGRDNFRRDEEEQRRREATERRRRDDDRWHEDEWNGGW